MAERRDGAASGLLDRFLLWCVGAFGGVLLLALGATWRIREANPPELERRLSAGQPVLFTFWHGRLLPLSYAHRRRKIVVLVSLHRDGEYIARIIGAMGFVTVRGSSTRGGHRALLRLVARARRGESCGISPDGPRGPRHVLQPGVITLASRSGVPIVLLAAGASAAWRIRSWDRFLIPKPFARCVVLRSEPIFVPRDLDDSAFEMWRREIEARLVGLNDEADRLSGQIPGPEVAGGRAEAR